MASLLWRTSYPHLRLTLVAMTVSALVASGPLATKVVVIGYPVPGSVLALPFCFSLMALYAEVYGNDAARRLMFVAVFCSLLGFGARVVLADLPTAPFWHTDAAVDGVNRLMPRLVFSTSIAFLLAEWPLLWIADHWQIKLVGSAYRLFALPLLAQATSSVIVVYLGYANLLTPKQLTYLFVSRCAFALLFAAFSAPFLVVMARFMSISEARKALNGGPTSSTA